MTFGADVVIYLLGVAAMAGTILARITMLEKKVEKHNSMVERTYKLEERVEAISEKIEDLTENT